jgi:hypothetical protein
MVTWTDDEQRVTAARLGAVIHGRPDPVRKLMDDAWWEGLIIGMVIAFSTALFIGLIIWQSAKGL